MIDQYVPCWPLVFTIKAMYLHNNSTDVSRESISAHHFICNLNIFEHVHVVINFSGPFWLKSTTAYTYWVLSSTKCGCFFSFPENVSRTKIIYPFLLLHCFSKVISASVPWKFGAAQGGNNTKPQLFPTMNWRHSFTTKMAIVVTLYNHSLQTEQFRENRYDETYHPLGSSQHRGRLSPHLRQQLRKDKRSH